MNSYRMGKEDKYDLSLAPCELVPKTKPPPETKDQMKNIKLSEGVCVCVCVGVSEREREREMEREGGREGESDYLCCEHLLLQVFPRSRYRRISPHLSLSTQVCVCCVHC